MEASKAEPSTSQRVSSPSTSKAPAVKKKAPAPPAPSSSKLPAVDVTRPCAEHNFLTDVSIAAVLAIGFTQSLVTISK